MAKSTKENRKIISQKYYHKNKQKILNYGKKYRKEHPDKMYKYKRKYSLKVAYGISVEQYDMLLQKQNGCCAICGKKAIELRQKLHVDHNHRTGTIRGLLCNKCNPVLGFVDDNIETLNKMITYLINWS